MFKSALKLREFESIRSQHRLGRPETTQLGSATVSQADTLILRSDYSSAMIISGFVFRLIII